MLTAILESIHIYGLAAVISIGIAAMIKVIAVVLTRAGNAQP